MFKFITKSIFSQKLLNYLKYKVERFLIKGPFYQLMFIALLIGVISFVCGQILTWIEPVKGGLAESSWWAFLHMSDPGYLGDNTGTLKRILATILTLLGYVLFMGSLVAIMTQWLYKTMKNLEAGYTAITAKGHISILGYTNRTPILVSEILSSKERLGRFLARKKLNSPQLAILNSEVSHELTNDLSTHLNSSEKLKKVIFRTGNPMQVDDLGRLNVEHSSVIVIPSSVYQGDGFEKSDARAIKSLLSVKNRSEQKSLSQPLVVAEILDDEKRMLAELAYGKNLRVISSRIFISRLIAQNIKTPGLSFVFAELLSNNYGNEIYLKEIKSLVGKPWREVRQSFSGVIPIGLVTKGQINLCNLNPKDEVIVSDVDCIVFIAQSFESIVIDKSEEHSGSISRDTVFKENPKQEKQILILGWSLKVPSLVLELLDDDDANSNIDIISIFPAAEREVTFKKSVTKEKLNKIQHIDGDYSVFNDLNSLNLNKYDHIIFLANDWIGSNIDADARSILGYLQLNNMEKINKDIPILVELADPENEGLFSEKRGEIIISPYVISSLLASVALRPDINSVFSELFQAKGNDFIFIDPTSLNLSGSVDFNQIKIEVCNRNMIALGVIKKDHSQVFLNPNKIDSFDNIENYKIIALQ